MSLTLKAQFAALFFLLAPQGAIACGARAAVQGSTVFINGDNSQSDRACRCAFDIDIAYREYGQNLKRRWQGTSELRARQSGNFASFPTQWDYNFIRIADENISCSLIGPPPNKGAPNVPVPRQPTSPRKETTSPSARVSPVEAPPQHQFRVANSCPLPVYFAVRYFTTDQTWKTVKWWRIEPGHSTRLLTAGEPLSSENPIAYYYGEVRGYNYTWTGTNADPIVEIGTLRKRFRKWTIKRPDFEIELECDSAIFNNLPH